MKNLTISLVQTPLHWENPEANIKMLSEKLKADINLGDIVVLPEMWTTGFTMNPEKHAEKAHEGIGFKWMLDQSLKTQKVFIGSIATIDGSKYVNRLYVCFPDGKYLHYDKRHLFRMAQEDKHYSSGDKRLVFEYNGWKICPLICYDLRFPVWSRNQWDNNGQSEYDLLIYVANWPSARAFAWSSLLVARAIENQCFVVGVNRVGDDGNKIPHNGCTALVNPRGETVSSIMPDEERIETIKLHASYLEEYRKVFPVGMDADRFTINL